MAQDGAFALILRRGADGQVFVHAVDIPHASVRHRIGFATDDHAEAVLHPDLFARLAALLDRIPVRAGVHSERDLSIALPGLTLADLKATLRRLPDGETEIVLRFRHFIGDLKHVLRRERPAASAFHPLFGVAWGGGEPRIPARFETASRKLEQISRQASEVNFYLTLITRYVSETTERPGPDRDEDLEMVRSA